MKQTNTNRATLYPAKLLYPIYHTFRHLSLAQQMELLWDEGFLLAERREATRTVETYELPGGFFCEVYYEAYTDVLQSTRCFASSE